MSHLVKSLASLITYHGRQNSKITLATQSSCDPLLLECAKTCNCLIPMIRLCYMASLIFKRGLITQALWNQRLLFTWYQIDLKGRFGIPVTWRRRQPRGQWTVEMTSSWQPARKRGPQKLIRSTASELGSEFPPWTAYKRAVSSTPWFWPCETPSTERSSTHQDFGPTEPWDDSWVLF